MKTKFIIAVSFFTIGICNAQTIYDLTDSKPDLGTNNYYIKDLNGILDPFVGTWIYTDGSNSITIVFKKKIKFKLPNDLIFEDMLYGGYRYVQNGIEIINTIPQIDDPNITNFFNYTIEGNGSPYPDPFYNDPNVSGDEIEIYMKEPQGVTSNLDMYITTISGMTALRVYKGTLPPATSLKGDPPPPQTVMPKGYLNFIKQ